MKSYSMRFMVVIFMAMLNFVYLAASELNELKQLADKIGSTHYGDNLVQKIEDLKKVTDLVAQTTDNLDGLVTDRGTTLLRLAVEQKYAPLVQALIDKNINVNQKSLGGNSALVSAAYDSTPEIVRMLLKAGAHVNINNLQVPLVMAILGHNDKEVVKMLLKAGADSNLQDKAKRTAKSAVKEILYSYKDTVDEFKDKKDKLEIDKILKAIEILEKNIADNIPLEEQFTEEDDIDPALLEPVILNILNRYPDKINYFTYKAQDNNAKRLLQGLSIIDIINKNKDFISPSLHYLVKSIQNEQAKLLKAQRKQKLSDIEILTQEN